MCGLALHGSGFVGYRPIVSNECCSRTHPNAPNIPFPAMHHVPCHGEHPRWTFVAAVYDQNAGNATLYVNGASVTSQTSLLDGGKILQATSTNQTTRSAENPRERSQGTALRFGAGRSVDAAADGSTGFVGLIDEAFVYGTALTVDELTYIYGAAQVRRGVGQLFWQATPRRKIMSGEPSFSCTVSQATIYKCSVTQQGASCSHLSGA